ncbi:hypothetical protein BDR26DRAFT_877511 [Obelidium mucronatum]|nr:hypothetical protein BDR26DRAFT_877511 [Obelidium mucronatum]
MATDSDHSNSNGPISARNYVVLGVLGGITAEVAISGLASTLPQLLYGKTVSNKHSLNYTALIMTNFNVACLIYMFNIFYDLYLSRDTCTLGHHLGNASSHYFYLSFDFFILFKSLAVSNMDRWVFRGAIFVFMNRLVWTVLDLIHSGGHWDPVIQQCSYFQHPLSGLGYNISDMIVDLFCTVLSIAFTWRLLNSKVTRIAEIILQENVIRSAIVLTVNSFELYASMTITDPFMTLVSYLIQNYIYTRCLNAELFWISMRRKGFMAPPQVLDLEGFGENSALNREIKESLEELGKIIPSPQNEASNSVGLDSGGGARTSDLTLRGVFIQTE